jgi:1,4-alpha-glucan branching enzyme
MGTKAAYDLWWKNAVIYCVDVELFADADGDGVGDFPGLTDKVDDLAGLGVTCIWLMPFYPTPNKDNGYDISDFYGVDPRLGTLGDFVEFLRAARERGIRVIADLVVNHTASTPTCPTSTSPAAESGTRSPRSSATGWTWAFPASGSTPPRS